MITVLRKPISFNKNNRISFGESSYHKTKKEEKDLFTREIAKLRMMENDPKRKYDAKLNQLAQQKMPLIKKVLSKFNRSRHLKEELESAGLEGLVKAIQAFVKGNFDGFACTIIRNSMIDAIRKEYGKTNESAKRLKNTDVSVDTVKPLVETVTPEDLLQEKQGKELIDRTLEGLSSKKCGEEGIARNASIFKQFVLEGIPQKEIAQRLNMSKPRVNQVYKSVEKKIIETAQAAIK